MPYSVGLHSAAAAFLSAGFATQFTIAVLAFLFIVTLISAFEKEGVDEPKHLPGFSFSHILPFFTRRYDFLNWGIQASGSNIYQFKLFRNTVIVVSGERARQAYFSAKNFDLTEGFKILSGAIPMVRGVTSDLQTKRVVTIHKRLGNIQRNVPLSSLFPYLLEDTRKCMDSWGQSGKFDPFDKVYELVFQLTIRCLSSTEIADSPELVARLKVLYDKLDNGTTPATVLLPWLPTPAMIKKLWATKEIYDIVTKAIRDREASGIVRDDTLQMLLDSSDEKLVVVGFIMGLITAGARATGSMASWVFTFLGGHQDWRSKATSEVESLLARYSNNAGDHLDSEAKKDPIPVSTRLGLIPLEAWESETPVLDAIIRETTRLAQPHTAMRRNLGPDTYIDGRIIPSGAYVIYPFSDVHLDPEIYPDPWRFDPSREQVKDIPFTYIGWGGGKWLLLAISREHVRSRYWQLIFVFLVCVAFSTRLASTLVFGCFATD
ncbi:cytochrome P450 [Crepidotus variabilis]|uniref:Cytochrome P450 n=1 Tax=Crepidotus variabilis TaxID=179855 RepID=A0A9P6EKF2_9AGAR|nr:cytochrome P450 [Crepidotus variabilis]